MPFMRAATISGHENKTVKGVSSQEKQDAMKLAVQEMQYMNSLLKQIQLILSGI